MGILIFLLVYLLGCIVAFFMGTYDMYISCSKFLNSDMIITAFIFSLFSWFTVVVVSISLCESLLSNMTWSKKKLNRIAEMLKKKLNRIAEMLNRLYGHEKF